MQNIVLTVHLILAALLIGVVLLQRSEGGGLGMGSTGGVMTGRQAANALTRVTWLLAAGFLVTSIGLTLIAARSAGSGSIMDRFGGTAPAQAPASNLPALPSYSPPPAAGQPVTPPTGATTAPATPAEATPAATAPAAVTPAPVTPAPAPAATPAPGDTGTVRTITVPVGEPPAAPAN